MSVATSTRLFEALGFDPKKAPRVKADHANNHVGKGNSLSFISSVHAETRYEPQVRGPQHKSGEGYGPDFLAGAKTNDLGPQPPFRPSPKF